METAQRDLIGVTICSSCGGDKKDDNDSYCPSCRLESRRTKSGIVTSIYGSQRSNSRRRGHRMPEYTKQELQDWLFSQTLFHELFDEWTQSGHKSRLRPSVDRKLDDIHYCMRNIQLMTWGENNTKVKDKRYKAIKKGKPIEVFKYGKSVGRFVSIMQANRELNDISLKSLKRCLRDEQTTKGYTVLAI